MPTLAKTSVGTVTQVWGTAYVRTPDGKLHLLKVGSVLHEGDQILTTQDGIVQITTPDGEVQVAKARPDASAADTELDRVIADLNAGDAQAAPAAGVAGGGGDGSFEPGLRVERVSESVFPAQLQPAQAVAQNQVTPATFGRVDAADTADTGSPVGPTRPAPTLALDSITADGVVNAGEATGMVVISGTAGGGAQAGDTVSVSVNGKTFTGTLDNNLHFSIDVPGSDIAADTQVTATVTTAGSAAGVSATQGYSVDTAAAASLAIDPLANGNVVNAAAAAGTVAVTGSAGGDARQGDTVTLTVNGKTFTGTLDNTLHFSIEVPGSDLQADSQVRGAVTVTDNAGNSATAAATHGYAVDQTATASLAINTVAGDDIVNAAEAGRPIAITGSAGGDAKQGDTVTLTVNGKTFTGTLDGTLHFSIDVPGSDLAADSQVQGAVTVTDTAGNQATATASHGYTVDQTATASLTIDTIAGDNVVNASEAGGTIAITGSAGGDAKQGDTVTLTVNGKTFTGTLDNTLHFSINVPGSDLAADGQVQGSVTVTDTAGNQATATASHGYTVDQAATASLTIDTVAGDDIVNAAEAAGSIAITGHAGGDARQGDTVTLSVNGKTFTGTLDSSLHFSIDVPGSDLAADGQVQGSVTVTDTAGNQATATASHGYTVDQAATVSLTIDTVAGDDIVNAAEAAGSIAITGHAGGDARQGDTVTLSVNGKTFTGTLDSSLHFSIDVPGSDLAADGQVQGSVTVTDTAGNQATATASHGYTVDQAATASLTIDTIAGDNVVNASEAGGPIAITGSAGGDARQGDTVTLSVNGKTFTGTLDNTLHFSINVPGSDLAADSQVQGSVTVTDTAGNQATATASHGYTVDQTATASLTIDTIAGDNVVNASEAGGPIAITGSAGGDARQGDTVTLSVNGKTFTGTLDNTLHFSINVPGSDLAADGQVQGSVTVTDTAGNQATATASHGYTVDQTATTSLTINTVAGDDIVNAAEAGGPIAITGSAGGDAKQGDTVTLSVNGKTFTGTLDNTLHFSINVPGSDLAADSQVQGSVTVTDTAGNQATATASHGYTVDQAATASLTIDTIAGDNVVNASEAGGPIAITGSAGGDAKQGDTVTLTVNGKTFTGTLDNTLHFSINVPGSDMAADSQVQGSVTVIDTAGNQATATASHGYTVDQAATTSLTINTVAGDDIVNAAEAGGPIAITGSAGGDAKQGDIVTLSVNGKTFTGTLDGTLHFSIDVPGNDMAADSQVQGSVTVIDNAGNQATATASHGYTVDQTATASLTIDTIAGDNVVNASEAGGPIAITGSAGGDARQGDTVTLSVNGKTFTGTLDNTLHFSINVPGSDLAADSQVQGFVTVTDTAGNQATATASHGYTVDQAATASLTINTVAGDDIVNAAEAGGPIAITGSAGGDAKQGDTVTLSVNGKTFTGTLDNTLHFSINVPGSDLAADGQVQGSVTVTDTAGNQATATASHGYTVDQAATASLTIDTIAGDNVVNASEAGGPIAITGSAGGDAKQGDTVTLTVNGKTFTGTLDGTLHFSIDVPGSDLAADSQVQGSVTVTDTAGNQATATASHGYTVDQAASASLTIDTVAGDDIVNAAEAGGPIAITGSAGGDAKQGDTVTLTVNGKTFTGTLDNTLHFSINVPGSDLAADSQVQGSVTVTDTAGNQATATASHGYTVDQTATASLTIDTIAGDNVVNAAEAAGSIAITGHAGGDARQGDTVTLSVNGKTFTGTLDNTLHFSINVPGSDLAADSQVQGSVTVTDTAGNQATATASHGYTVDQAASASLTIDTVASDDIVNATEAGGPIAITGSAGGDAKQGDTVTLTVNGKAFTGTLDSSLHFSIDVPGSDLQNDSQVVGSVTVTDNAGNQATATASHGYTVDQAATASLTIDTIAGDNVVNASEASGPIAITGSAGGDAKQGDTVTLTVNGKTFTGTLDNALHFSIAVPGSDLAADSHVQGSVTVTDSAGNAATAAADAPYRVNAAPVAGDAAASVSEDSPPLAASVSTSDADADGITVTGVATGVQPSAAGWVGVPIAGLWGTLTLHADGTYTYAPLPAAQQLVTGQLVDDVFTYTVADGPGDSATATITIHVIGADDPAVISGDIAGNVFEDGTVVSAGKLDIADPDAGQAAFLPQTGVAGSHGSFSITADGHWTYTLDNAAADVQSLALGQQVVETFTVAGADGTLQTITVTVHGSNDAPVAVADVASLSGDAPAINGNVISGGPGADHDIDATDTLSVSGVSFGGSNATAGSALGGAYGTLVLNADGSYTYTPGATAQALPHGSSATDVFSYTVSDGHGGTATASLTITVNGAEHAPTLAPAHVSGVEDTAHVFTLADFGYADTDGDALQSLTVHSLPANGTLQVFDGSSWVAVSAGQSLAPGVVDAGQLRFVPAADESGDAGYASFSVSATDSAGLQGAPATLTIDIAPRADAPTLGADPTGAAPHPASTGLTLSWYQGSSSLPTTNVGQAENLVPNLDAEAPLQSTTVHQLPTPAAPLDIAQGDAYRAAGLIYLEAGHTYTFGGYRDDTLYVEVGGTPVYSVGFNAWGDFTASGFTPAASGYYTFDLYVYNGNGQGSIGVNVSVDGAAPVPVSDAGFGLYTGIADVDAAGGQHGAFVADGHGGFYPVALNTGGMDSAIHLSTLTAALTDTDGSEALSLAISALPPGAVLSDGVHSFTATAGNTTADITGWALDQVTITPPAGYTGSFTLGVTATSTETANGDSASTSLSIAVNVVPVNHDPVVHADGAITPYNTSLASIDVLANDTDADGDTLRVAGAVVDPSQGTVTVNADSTLSFTPATDYSGPAVVRYVIADGHGGQSIGTLTVQVGPAALITGDDTGTVVEAGGVANAQPGTPVVSGVLTVSDPDAGEATFQAPAGPLSGSYGSFSFDPATGAWTYTLDNARAATQALADGATAHDTLTVTSLDGSATHTIDVTIVGRNDAAAIGAPTVSTVTEDSAVDGSGHLSASGTISVSDADQGQAAFSAVVGSAPGNLGTLVLAADGSYTYTVANGAVQYLGAGETKVETFTVTSADGTAKSVSFTINGANDAAVIGTPTVSTVTEDTAVNAGNLTAAGSISITDADQGQAAFSTAVTGAAGNVGTLVLAANGAYTYTVANSDVQSLGAGQTKVDTFTVTSADGASKTVSFTVNGVNDTAVIGTPTVSTVTEDTAVNGSGNLTAAGTISLSDADQAQATFNTTVSSAAGNLGTLVLAANGSYTYTVANSATQFLGAGQTKVDTFTVTSADGTTKDISFTINGTNDAAVIGTPTVSTVTEDAAVNGSGNLTAAGTISVSDADQGQATFGTTVAGAAGNLGTLVLAANGSYTYTVANSATQYLGAGQTKVDTFTVTSADGTTKDVSFTINGVNDTAVIGTPTVSSVNEDTAVNGSGNLTASGSISISDADQGQATFTTSVSSAAGNLGTLVLAANGSYTYSVANSDVQFLGAGQTKVDTFTITSADGTSKSISFTINGANDTAVIGAPTVSTVTEDLNVSGGNLAASGSISISDADQGQAVFNTTVTPTAGNLGTLVLAANGSYTYSVANSDVQYLGAGQTKVDTFTITSGDGTSKSINFTINGANDAAVIGTPTVSSVAEDTAVNGSGNLVASGSISIADADQGQATFNTTVSPTAGNLGTLVLAANGSYTYSVANSDVQYLGAGQTKVDTFTITSADGTSKSISFTINGANDAAVIGTPTASTVTEDTAVNGSGNLTAAGTISLSDADQGQATFATTVGSAGGNLGTLVLATNGSYTYTVANSATQYLGAGQTKVDTFTVSSADGTTKDVSFTINGANDAAVIGTPTVSTVTEDAAVNGSGNLTAAGTISLSDADQGQATFNTTVSSAAGNLGTLVLAANGSYTYTVANSATQSLAAGQTKVDTFTVTSADGTTKDVSFTINGANDAAVIGTPTVSIVTEDTAVNGSGNLTANGTISISDADQGQATFNTTVSTAAGNLGTLVLGANGSYTYTVANSAVQYLGAGQTKVDTFTVTSADGTAKNVSFTINGVNDAAVIGTPTVSTVTEDTAVNGSGNLTAAGTISLSDADQGQATFNTTVSSAAGNLGTLVLAANGSYTYTVANSAVQYLGAGQTKVDTFTVTSADGTTKDVSFTINGANDAAVIGTPTVSTVTEDTAVNAGNLTAAGSISITDADQGQAAFGTAVTGAAGNVGTLVLAANGAYTYTVANSDVQYLGAGQNKVDTFTVTSADGTTKDVSFTINGANDAAVIGTPTVSTVTEDTAVNGSGNLTAAGTISLSDADQGQATFATTVASAAGNLGTLVLAANGSYTYTVANSATQYLGAGQTKVDTFTVTSADGTTKDVSFTINGANDAAVIGTPTVSTVTEDVSVSGGNLTAAGTISLSDADQGQATFNTTVSSAAGNLGTLVIAANGSYTYTVANSATQYLGAGQTKVDTFTVTSADGTTKDISFTINGANDAAVIGTPTVSTVTEDTAVNGSGNLTAAGTISISDADQGQATFGTTVASAAGNLGTLVLAANGSYTYTVANSATQSLGAGQTKVDTFTVTSADGTAKNVSFTINGVNDAAVIGTPTVSTVTEDTAVNGSGNLTAAGTISLSDADQGQATFNTTVSSAAGNLGTLVLAANGSYTYTVANSAVQYLGAGQTKVDTFTVTSADGTTKDVSFTINGVNDAALIVPTITAVTEDTAVNGSGNLTTSGTISISDADQGQAAFNTTVTPTAGNLGTLVLAANGSYTYTVANSATQYLGAGQTKVDTFTVTSADGTTKDVSFTINGANDAAVIGTPTVSTVTEDTAVNGSANLTAAGSISISDADQGQATFGTTVVSAAGNLGTLVLAANGSYTYTVANSATQSLGAGQTKVDTFTVTSADGTTKDVSFTINGANDAAVIGTPTVSTVTEDAAVNGSGNLTAAGTISITDADQGQATFNTTVSSAAGNLGTLVLAANGSYTYTVANSATQSLGAGQTKVDTFTVTSADGTSKSITFTVNGANDAAVIGTPTVSTVTEDAAVNGSGNLTAAGTISLSDADQGQATFATTVSSAAGNLGTLALAANGSYTYTVANSATQFLGAGQTKVDTFTVTSADGTTKDVSFTINGANDAAVIGTPTVSTVTEDTAVNGSGNLTAAGTISLLDADQGQATFNTTISSAAGNLGTLVLAANGSYTYTVANSAVQYLGSGQTKVDTFTVTSVDGTTKSVNFTINGSNDGPVAVADTGALNENATLSRSAATGVLANDTDVDAGDSKTVSAVAFGATNGSVGSALNGTYGTLTLNADGSYTYSANRPAADALAQGQTATDTFSYTVRDSAGATSSTTLAFTVTGTNDNPVASADTGSVIAGGTLTVSAANGIILSGAVPAGKDTDAEGDTLSVAQAIAGTGTPNVAVSAGGTLISGTYGDLTLTSSGSYTYVANKAGAIATGSTANDVFTYQVSDGHGGTATATLTVQVAGQGDTLTGTSSQAALANPLGLGGEYYGYNDANPNNTTYKTYRRHGDDGAYGNLDAVSDATGIINGRDLAKGGSGAVVGTGNAVATNAADAVFTSHALDYGFSPQVNGDLGLNANVAAGGTGLTAANSALYSFLSAQGDQSTISVQTGTGDNDAKGSGPTSGIGQTSDALIRIAGDVYLAAGMYDIRVTADDGFSLRIDGNTVAEFDGIQSPTTRVYSGMPVGATGTHDLELLYWDQGGNARLRVEFKPAGAADTEYHVLGTDQYALFSPSNVPALSDTQDLVNVGTSASPVYQVRTGATIDGGAGNDTITGSAARDVLRGGADNDTVNGAAGDDTLYGSSGSDMLTGGAGHDVFRWELADRGTAGNAPRDVITDFDNNNYSGDVLDLRDLLVGETHTANTVSLPGSIDTDNPLTIGASAGNLGNYLHFSTSGGNTVIEISSTGGFSGGYSAAAVDQVIQVNGVNLTSGFSTDTQIIADLLKRGKLVTDGS